MTQDSIGTVRSIAIIGGGAAGLTALFELLHTRKDGSTSLRYNTDGSLDEAGSANDDPAFDEIVVFEQGEKVGGVWNPSFEEPDIIPQKLLDTERYDDPTVLRPRTKVPHRFKGEPYQRPFKVASGEVGESPLKWHRSGIYKSLYSNVARRYLRNSFIPFEERKFGSGRPIDPFLTNFEISDLLFQFVKKNGLEDYVRVNSEVVDVSRDKNGLAKWAITVRESDTCDGSERWYSQSFDAVIVSNGHYAIPHVPRIEGLSKWNKESPTSILHSKSFRDESIFKDKRVVFVGTGLSGIDIIQYAFPIAKETIVARTPGKKEIYEWLDRAAMSTDIVVRPRIASVDYNDKRTVTFSDGSRIENVDIIVFSTGYHWHYPFLNQQDSGVSVKTDGEETKVPNNNSLVDGLYLSIFSNKEPTLAFVGVLVTPFKWPSFEVESSIISGVWSGAASLPPQQERKITIERKEKESGSNIMYHTYLYEQFPTFIEENKGLFPKGRRATDIFDAKYMSEQKHSQKVAEKLFYELKGGSISIHDTL